MKSNYTPSNPIKNFVDAKCFMQQAASSRQDIHVNFSAYAPHSYNIPQKSLISSFEKQGGGHQDSGLMNKSPVFHQTMFGANSRATPTQKTITLTGKNGSRP